MERLVAHPRVDRHDRAVGTRREHQRGARGGTFSTAGFNSYWDRIGVSSDRNERQISNFADAATIQMQMRQANASRKRGENPVKMVDWKEHKLQVKKAKLQQAKAALLRDDD